MPARLVATCVLRSGEWQPWTGEEVHMSLGDVNAEVYIGFMPGMGGLAMRVRARRRRGAAPAARVRVAASGAPDALGDVAFELTDDWRGRAYSLSRGGELADVVAEIDDIARRTLVVELSYN